MCFWWYFLHFTIILLIDLKFRFTINTRTVRFFNSKIEILFLPRGTASSRGTSRSKGQRIALCFAALWLLLSSSLLADTLFLKDGTALEGRILGQDRTSVTIQLQNGQVRRVQKDSLKRISYDDSAERERLERQRLERERLENERKAREKLEQEKKEQQIREREKLEQERKAREQEEARKEKERQAALKKPTQESQEVSTDRTFGALWRAALLPGWGHYYTDRPDAGKKIGAGFAAILFLALFETRETSRLHLDYEKASQQLYPMPFAVTADSRPAVFSSVLSQISSRERIFRRHERIRNDLLTLAFCLYAFQIGHAAFYAGAGSSSVTGTPERTIVMGIVFHDVL